MTPILYLKTDRKSDLLNTNGIGFLADCISCIVTEEKNGEYSATFKYPINGIHAEKIELGGIIKAKPNETAEPQCFRIHKASKPLNGVVTYYADHISYDLNGLPVNPFSLQKMKAQAAMNAVLNLSIFPHEFTAESDFTTSAAIEQSVALSVRSCLGGVKGSILNKFNGEFEFDNFTVKLWVNRGNTGPVMLRYGKNITDLKQEEKITECYTHILPYAKKTEDNAETTIYLSERVIELLPAADIGHKRALVKDFSEYFDEDQEFTEDNLRQKVNAYIKSANLTTPDINITLSFAALWKSKEYETIKTFERVSLCDMVNVYFEKLNISAPAKIIKTVYNTLTEQYESIEIGKAKANFADTMADISDEIKSVGKKITAEVAQAVAAETTRATTAEESLSLRITQTDRSIETEIKRAKREESTLSSKITDAENAITEEETRATTAESTLSSRITQTESSITSEVTRATKQEEVLSGKITDAENAITEEETRATTAESTLSSRITQTESSITSEVTRATTAERKLSSRIAQTESEIAGKVSNTVTGDSFSFSLLSTGINVFSAGTGVLSIDKSGLAVYGKITATELVIASEVARKAGIALSGDIPTDISAFTNDKGYQTAANVTTIIGDTVTTGFVEALNISVSAAQIGELSADKITSGTLDCANLTVQNLSANSITGGTLDFNAITVKNLYATSLQCAARSGYSSVSISTGYIDFEKGSFIGEYRETGGFRIGKLANEITFTESGTTRFVNIGIGNNSSVYSNVVRSATYNATKSAFRVSTSGSTALGELNGSWYIESANASTSDRRKKHDIEDLDNRYYILFDCLRPVRFKYNDGTSGRYHTGFIAQELQQSITAAELTEKECAAIVTHLTPTNEDETEFEEVLGIRYEELIAILWAKVKRQSAELEKLKQEVRQNESM